MGKVSKNEDFSSSHNFLAIKKEEGPGFVYVLIGLTGLTHTRSESLAMIPLQPGSEHANAWISQCRPWSGTRSCRSRLTFMTLLYCNCTTYICPTRTHRMLVSFHVPYHAYNLKSGSMRSQTGLLPQAESRSQTGCPGPGP
jgi:hypothetical protein